MKVLVWHVHGSWATAFVQGPHTYYVPVVPDRGPDGRGRARTWEWPDSVVEVTPEQMGDLDVDVVVVQRPHEFELAEAWLGPRVADIPTVYVEHDTPLDLRSPRHHVHDRDGVVLVHVTHFNALMWQSGDTPVQVIEHGVVDPGQQYSGELAAAVAAINEPVRRRWVAGTDLVELARDHVDVDLFGMQSESLGGRDVPQHELHVEMARRAVYLHPFRWTSLGLSLVEAMHLGMPVVALAATEVPRILPGAAGVVAHDVREMIVAVRRFIDDREAAHAAGAAARTVALDRFSLDRFLADWDDLLDRVAQPTCRARRVRAPRRP